MVEHSAPILAGGEAVEQRIGALEVDDAPALDEVLEPLEHVRALEPHELDHLLLDALAHALSAQPLLQRADPRVAPPQRGPAVVVDVLAL